jgi:TonB family protein
MTTMQGNFNYTIILTIVVSTILHFLAMVVLNNISLLPRRITPHTHTYIVDLLPPPPKPALAAEKPTPAPKPPPKKVEKEPTKKEEKKPVPKEKEQVTLKTKPSEKKKKQEPKKVIKPRKKPAPRVSDEQRRRAAVTRIEKQLAERKERESAAAVRNSIQGIYYGLIEARVKNSWVIPDTLSQLDGLRAVIVITLDKDGLVLESRFEQSSGNAHYDQSAMRAITKAAPFPPPPPGLDLPVEIGLEFVPNQGTAL